MGVQAVHDQHDPVGVGVVTAQQAIDLVGPVRAGAPVPGDDASAAGERLDLHEGRAGPASDVLRVHLEIAAGRGWDRRPGVGEQLVGVLVHSHDRLQRVVGVGVDRQHVFHPRDELAVRVRWNGLASLQMRTKRRLPKIRADGRVVHVRQVLHQRDLSFQQPQ